MKVQHTIIPALFVFATCAMADDLTLKTNDGILPTEFEWSDTSVWSPDGSSLDNANLAIDGTAEAAVNSTITGGLNLGGYKYYCRQWRQFCKCFQGNYCRQGRKI